MTKQQLIKQIKELDKSWYEENKGSLLENVYIGEEELTDLQEVKRSLQNALDLKEEIRVSLGLENEIKKLVNQL